MKSKFKIGDKVEVLDKGLEMLRQFAPKNAWPNNHGIVSEIWDDGTILVEFPVDGEEDHSQVAPYAENLVKHRNK